MNVRKTLIERLHKHDLFSNKSQNFMNDNERHLNVA